MSSRLRVAKVVTGFPRAHQPGKGIFNLRAAKLLNHSADVTVVHLRTWIPGRRSVETSDFEGIPVLTVAIPQMPGGGNLNFLINDLFYQRLGWPLVRSLLRTCNLIHSVGASAGILASPWGRWARVHHLTQVIGSDINSILPRIHRSRAIVGWERHVQGVACNSRALASAFSALYPENRNVRTVYRGVDLESFCPTGSVLGPLTNCSPVRFLYLGGSLAYRFLPHGVNTKGGETLLAAWRAVEHELVALGASLLFAGPDANNRRIARWRLDLQRPDLVHIAGIIPPKDIAAYLRSADVVLVPSMEEGLPNVAMEASACARPVFGSNVGGIPEVVVHGETGLVLPAGDVAAWSRALVEYASQTDTLHRMGQRARERMEAYFNCKQYASKILGLYETILSDPINETN